MIRQKGTIQTHQSKDLMKKVVSTGQKKAIHYLKEDEEGNIYRQKQRHDVWSDIPSLGQLGT